MRVGDSDRLDRDILGAALFHRRLRRADQRRTERLHMGAEVAMAFGEE